MRGSVRWRARSSTPRRSSGSRPLPPALRPRCMAVLVGATSPRPERTRTVPRLLVDSMAPASTSRMNTSSPMTPRPSLWYWSSSTSHKSLEMSALHEYPGGLVGKELQRYLPRIHPLPGQGLQEPGLGGIVRRPDVLDRGDPPALLVDYLHSGRAAGSLDFADESGWPKYRACSEGTVMLSDRIWALIHVCAEYLPGTFIFYAVYSQLPGQVRCPSVSR